MASHPLNCQNPTEKSSVGSNEYYLITNIRTASKVVPGFRPAWAEVKSI